MSTLDKLKLAMQFNDDQAMLLEAAQQFCREQSPIAQVRARLADRLGGPAALWGGMVEMGWISLAVPETQGGLGLGLGEALIVAEAMGQHLMATPFTCTQVFAHAVKAALKAPLTESSDRQNIERLSEALRPLSLGQARSFAVFDSRVSWDLSVAPSMQLDNAGKLHGEKTLVPDALAVGGALVSATDSQGNIVLALVDGEAWAQLPKQQEHVIDQTRRVYRVHFDACTPSLILRGKLAQAALRAIEQASMALLAADACGAQSACLNTTVDYLNSRSAFGHKIGSYQALKHTCATMLINLERSRSHLYHVVSLLSQSDRDTSDDSDGLDHAIRMAKAEAGEGLVFAGDRAVQFHGGFGFTWDCDAHFYLRRGQWIESVLGDGMYQRERLAQQLLG